MMDVELGLRVAINLVSVLVTGYFLVIMWRVRSEPTSLPLLGVAVVVFLGAVVHPLVTTFLTKFWFLSMYSVIVFGGGFWFLFALRYTGRGGRVTPLAVALVAGLSVTMLGIDIAGATSLFRRFVLVNVLLNSVILVLASLVVIGLIVVVTVSYEENEFLIRGSMLLSGGAAVLVLVPVVASKFPNPVVVPSMFIAASGLLSVAVSRYRPFEMLPVVRVAGRDRIIEELSDAVVVVDRDGRVRDLNPSAETVFDIDRSAVLGRPLGDVFPVPFDTASAAAAQEPTHVRTDDDTILSVTVRSVTDDRDRLFGHLLVCQDVTDRRNREDRLAVLNHLLTGAMREQMGAVADDVTALLDSETAEATDPEGIGDGIYTTTTDLLTLVERTREVERALANGDGTGADERTDAVPIVRDVVNADSADIDIVPTLPDGPVPVAIGGSLLRTTVETLLDDAVRHAAETVAVAVEETDEMVTIRIVDDGPSESDSAEDEGQFSDGISMQIARLAVEHANGSVSVSPDETDGRRIRVRLPGIGSASRASGRTDSSGRDGSLSRDAPSPVDGGAER
ncbi:PAS domain-containing protein [Haladaptatus paucihalophilus]|uniref:PAS domain S-box-containing protein n=2 Tax=Haladaptatus paucihalophilus DX253 TaxID=797209 RepID=A0A1M6X7J3_HALPU|nr:PAS domain-containing protein [Haladaptatus paucihalophilus]SHL01921.1 PAS domain S-box-containing protein [Haladaptatus paucihalophilus DX253]